MSRFKFGPHVVIKHMAPFSKKALYGPCARGSQPEAIRRVVQVVQPEYYASRVGVPVKRPMQVTMYADIRFPSLHSHSFTVGS